MAGTVQGIRNRKIVKTSFQGLVLDLSEGFAKAAVLEISFEERV